MRRKITLGYRLRGGGEGEKWNVNVSLAAVLVARAAIKNITNWMT